MIYVENKKRKLEKVRMEYPEADILDITSSTETRYAQILSPFYPHGNIPIPNSPGYYATCVEAVWQGLKVFEGCDIDMNTFKNDTMKNLKRTVRKYGKPLGHRYGIDSQELLGYFDARMKIYLPTYLYVLEKIPEVQNVVQRIAERAKTHDIVFLDYNTNIDFRDVSSPLSHAGLVKLYIEGNYPREGESFKPMSKEEIEEKKQNKKQAKANKKNSVIQLNLFD